MITFQIVCEDCQDMFEQRVFNCNDEAIEALKRLDSEIDTGKKQLCPDCFTKHNLRLAEEDARQQESDEVF